MEKRKLSVYVDEPTLEALDLRAAEVGSTRAQVARHLLERSLERAVPVGTDRAALFAAATGHQAEVR